MSGMEIERKFIVNDDSYKQLAYSHSHIKQGYICSGHGRTVRVRLRDDKAYLTIKGPSTNGGMSRYEFEKEITPDEGRHLFELCEPGAIDKVRWLVKSGAHTFEVDEFFGDNEGLVMAEIELKEEGETFIKPDFIGAEVTGDRRFYNSFLTKLPFKAWSASTPRQKPQ